MIIIAPVKTGNSNKSLWFDASKFVDADIIKQADEKQNSKKKRDNALEKEILATAEIKTGDNVVVNTARGQEFGTVTASLFVATDKQIKNLKSELKDVRRKAKDIDFARRKEMKKRGLEVLPTFKDIAAELNPKMHPIDVEYLLDGRKAIFYFSAPERQDFRELVKRLSSELHIRVDMHQINDRDKAKLVSGIGVCGQELCCARTGRCPKHVSIKMAKAQGLSLNPENISGSCGKLMCCLNYEYDLYEEFVKRAPKLKAKIETPEGIATVTDVNMPNETVQIKYGDPEKRLRLPLSSIVAIRRKGQDKNQNVRPNTIKQREWEAALEADNYLGASALTSIGSTSGSSGSFDSINFSGDEKLSDGKVRKMPTRRRRSTTLGSDSSVDGDANLSGQDRNNKRAGQKGRSNGQGGRKSGRKNNRNKNRRNNQNNRSQNNNVRGQNKNNTQNASHGQNNCSQKSNALGQNNRSQNKSKKNNSGQNNNQRNNSVNNNSQNKKRSSRNNSRNKRRDVYRTDTAQTRQRRSRTISSNSSAKTGAKSVSKSTARPGQNSSGLRNG